MLELEGALPGLALSGGEPFDELTRKPELLGRILRIHGKLDGSPTRRAPHLIVESWDDVEEGE